MLGLNDIFPGHPPSIHLVNSFSWKMAKYRELFCPLIHFQVVNISWTFFFWPRCYIWGDMVLRVTRGRADMSVRVGSWNIWCRRTGQEGELIRHHTSVQDLSSYQVLSVSLSVSCLPTFIQLIRILWPEFRQILELEMFFHFLND